MYQGVFFRSPRLLRGHRLVVLLLTIVLTAGALGALASTLSGYALLPATIPGPAAVAGSANNLAPLAQANGSRLRLDTVPRIVAPARSVQDMDWGDVDGDGDLDLALGTYRRGNWVYLNNDGDFSQVFWTDGMTNNNSYSIAWGDVDGDGDLDLAVGLNGAPNRLYLNESGVLQTRPAWTDEVDDPTTDLAWGDIDGDGYLDLVVANRGAENKIYLNTKSGSLNSAPVWTDGRHTDHTTSVDLADMDGRDGLDIAFSNAHTFDESGQRVCFPTLVYRNTSGPENMALAIAWRHPAGAVHDIAWAPLDNDAYPELALVDVWFGGGDGVFVNSGGDLEQDGGSAEITRPCDFFQGGPPRWQPQTDGLGLSVAWGDADGDGDLDLAMGFSTDTAEQVYLNNGRTLARTPAWEAASLERGVDITWADVDGDGDLDLAVIYGGRVNVYNNHQAPLSPSALPLPASGRPAALAWGDVDNDGDLDLAVGNDDGLVQIYENAQGISTNNQVTTLSAEGGIRDLAWGDVDGDGFLDLAVAHYTGPTRVYLNENGVIDSNSPPPALGGRERTQAVAWGDADGDGDLDLAVGNDGSPNWIYLNENGGLAASAAITFSAATKTASLAWGDADGDGDLDLAVGNLEGPNQIYFNDRGNLSEERVQSFGSDENTYSLAWGDVDGDGRLDLATANSSAPNQLYLNAGGRLAESPAWLSLDLDDSRGVALGDVDGDGDLDLAVANASGEDGAAPQVARLYMNENGRLQTVADAPWSPATIDPSYEVAWGDMDGDGDLDLAAASRSGAKLYENIVRPAHPFRAPVTISLEHESSAVETAQGSSYRVLAPADFYAVAGIRQDGQIPFTYRLTHPDNEPVRAVRGFYSLDGGGHWRPAQPLTGTLTTNLSTAPGDNTHTYVWDVFGSGFYGQSDNVVFRLEAYDAIPGAEALPPGTFLYTDQRAGLYQRAAVAITTRPFRVRGSQIQVSQEGAGDAGGVAGSIVYHLPAGRVTGASPLGDQSGQPYLTDDQGFLQGRTNLEAGDQLVALWPAPSNQELLSFTSRATLYYMSAAPIAAGLQATPVSAQAGIQALTVSAARPLLLFDLDVSLEWDARNDPVFLLELEESFKRASELLFDVSDGQVALGHVQIHHARENWLASEIVILANSSIRPSASMGGLVFDPVADTIDGQLVAGAYVPGQIRMGTVWDPFRQNTADLGEDWKRALAHELSHFLLFLPDNYLGIDRQTGVITTIDCRGSFMTNTYDDSYSEFLTRPAWDQRQPCREDTLAAHTTGRSDWETIQTFYPFLSSAGSIEGPHLLPLNVTQVTFAPVQSEAQTLPVRVFDIRGGTQSFIRVPQAQAYLFQRRGTEDISDDAVLALGAPFGGGDRVKVRGASVGDRLCLIDLTSETVRLGCQEIQPASVSVRVQEVDGWRPNINVQAVTSRTLLVTATNSVAIPGSLNLQVFPAYGSPDRPDLPILAPAAEMSPADETRTVFTGTVTLAFPAFEGHVRVWADGFTVTREAISQYLLSLPFGPNDRGGSGPNDRGGSGPNDRGGSGPNDRGGSGPNDRGGSGPNDRGGSGPNDRGGSGPNDRGGSGANTRAYFANYRALGAPIQSSDGQATIYNIAGYFEDSGVGSLQALAAAPNLAPWLAPVGQAYRFASESDFAGSRSITFHYLQREVPDGYERALTLFFSADEGATWEKLNTEIDDYENLAVAPMRAEDGIYVLVATLEMPPLQPGWNLFAYPLLDTRPVTEALASLTTGYLIYDASQGPSPAPATNSETGAGRRFTALVDLNVRAGPGSQYDTITFLRRGESVAIRGSNADTGWWWIDCPPGPGLTIECWVSGNDGYDQVAETAAAPTVINESPMPPGVAAATQLEFGHVYWLWIGGEDSTTLYLAPPTRTDRSIRR